MNGKRVFSLAPCGDLTWEEESRTAELTLEPEPMQKELDELTASLNEWKEFGGSHSHYELYPNAYGILYVEMRSGTSHGEVWNMIQVYPSGRKVDIGELLARRGVSFQMLRDVQVIEAQRSVSFFAQMWSVENGERQEWGETYCTFSLDDPKIMDLALWTSR